MNLEKTREEYIKSLPKSDRSIKIIENYLNLTHVLNHEQKKLIRAVVANGEITFTKKRRVGATTAIDAFLSVEAFMTESPITIMIMCPYRDMCEEHYRNLRDFLSRLPLSLNKFFMDDKIFKCCTHNKIHLKNDSKIIFVSKDNISPLCGLTIDYAVFDECLFNEESIIWVKAQNPKKIITINTVMCDKNLKGKYD